MKGRQAMIFRRTKPDPRIEDEAKDGHADAEGFCSPKASGDFDIHHNRRHEVDRGNQQQQAPEWTKTRDSDHEHIDVVPRDQGGPAGLARFLEHAEPPRHDGRHRDNRPTQHIGE